MLSVAIFRFLVCGRCGRGLLPSFWRCAGHGIRGSGSRRCPGGGCGVARESWTASPDRRGDRGRKRASGWGAGRARLPSWRATVRRLVRRGGRAMRVFYIDDPIADPLAHGKSEFVEPAAEGAVFVKDALEFRGDDGDAFCGVGYEAEMDGFAEGGVGSGLHAPFDEHAVIALAGGEDGSAKRETVDFAFDSDLGARSPDFRDVERDADNDPAESRGDALESGFEGLGDKFGLRLHGGFRGAR